jgi:hypothetical protein
MYYYCLDAEILARRGANDRMFELARVTALLALFSFNEVVND